MQHRVPFNKQRLVVPKFLSRKSIFWRRRMIGMAYKALLDPRDLRLRVAGKALAQEGTPVVLSSRVIAGLTRGHGVPDH